MSQYQKAAPKKWKSSKRRVSGGFTLDRYGQAMTRAEEILQCFSITMDMVVKSNECLLQFSSRMDALNMQIDRVHDSLIGIKDELRRGGYTTGEIESTIKSINDFNETVEGAFNEIGHTIYGIERSVDQLGNIMNDPHLTRTIDDFKEIGDRFNLEDLKG